jgi:hypothetical protein
LRTRTDAAQTFVQNPAEDTRLLDEGAAKGKVAPNEEIERLGCQRGRLSFGFPDGLNQKRLLLSSKR